MDADDDDIQEVDNNTWNYLDGSPAQTPDSDAGAGIIGRAISDVANWLNPFSRLRKKVPPAQQRRRVNERQSRRPIQRPEVISQINPPPKRRRANTLVEFGQSRLDEYPQDPPRNGLPPNVLFGSDERPPGGAPRLDYITEDEDSDIEDDKRRRPNAPSPPGPASLGVKKPSQNPFSIPVRRNLADSSVQRTPLTEQKTNADRAWNSPFGNRKPNLLPTVSPIKIPNRHPMTAQTGASIATPAFSPNPISRKRNFTEVEQDEVPSTSKAQSGFPRSAERRSFGPINRFGYQPNRPASDAASRKMPLAPNAMRRYAGLPNLATATSVLKKPEEIKTSPASSAVSSPKSNIRLPDFHFVISKNTAMTGSDVSQFQFSSVAVLPSGRLAADLTASLEKFAEETKNTPFVVKKCKMCGIRVMRGEECDVCERLSLAASKQSASTSAQGPDKGSADSRKLNDQDVQLVDEGWMCTLCDKLNRSADPECARCFSKKDIATRRATSKAAAAENSQQKRDRSESPSVVRKSEERERHADTSKDVKTETATKPDMNTSKSDAPPAGFVDIWSKQATAANNWTCPGCMCSNKPESAECPACETPKPGTIPTKKAAPAPTASFVFGTAQPSDASTVTKSVGFNFGVTNQPATTSNTSKPAFPSLPAGGFSFGTPAATNINAPPPVSTSIFGDLNKTAASNTRPTLTAQPTTAAGATSIANGPVPTAADGGKSSSTHFNSVVNFGAVKTSNFFGSDGNAMAKKPEEPAGTAGSQAAPFSFFASTSTAPTTSTFGGFANGTMSSAATSVVPNTSAAATASFFDSNKTSTSAPAASLFGTAKATAPASNIPAPGFFGGQPASGGLFDSGSSTQPSFGGFGGFGAATSASTSAQTSTTTTGGTNAAPSLFGSLNTATPLFGAANGIGSWGSQPVQNGHTAPQAAVPFGSQGLPAVANGFGAPGQVVQDGTFGGTLIAPPARRNIVRAKRNIQR